jgi:hypothetical protein
MTHQCPTLQPQNAATWILDNLEIFSAIIFSVILFFLKKKIENLSMITEKYFINVKPSLADQLHR